MPPTAILLSMILAQVEPPAGFKLEEWPLDRVLRAVHEQNASLAAARAGVDAASGQVQKAWTAWQPELSAIGQVTFNSVEQSFDIGQVFGPIITFLRTVPGIDGGQIDEFQRRLPPPTVLSPHVQWVGLATLKQTIFNITALRAPGVAKKGRIAAEAGAEAAEDEILFATATAYAALAGAKEFEGAALRASEVANKRIEDAKVQLAAGTTTKLAVTRAEAERAAAEGQLLSVRAQRRTGLAQLQALAGSAAPFEVSNQPLESAVKLDASGHAEDRAVVKARQRALEAAEAAIGLSNLNWLPTLAADGTLRYSNVEGFSGDKFLATATINLIIPLYDRGVRYADTRIAEAGAAQARAELEDQRRSAQAFLEEAEAKFQSAEGELSQAEAQLRFANEAVEQVEALVTNGLATNLDQSDADQKRFSADALVVQKKLELTLAKLRLHHARGGKLIAD